MFVIASNFVVYIAYIQIRNIIKKELILYGPTTMAFPVTEEFLHYESGSV